MSGPLPRPAAAPAPAAEASILIDAHVHVHRGFALDVFLDAAAGNLAAAARRLGVAAGQPGVLLLTEGAGARFFRRARDGAVRPAGGVWTLAANDDDPSLLALERGVPRLVLIAGRQVVTAEALEVLALGCDAELADGRPMAATLAAARRAGALVAVPWGFGKWWLRRGRLLAELIAREDPSDFFLGDNGGRPRGPEPKLFARAAERGIRLLPGSDPLPFPSQVGRVGSYGCRLAGALDIARPAAGLARLLRDPATRPRPFGAAMPWLPFLRAQAAMQLRKRRRSDAS